MVYVFFAFFLIYFLLLLALLAGWQIAVAEEKKTATIPEQRLLSIIVPFRNEASIITALIHSLQRQTHELFEVILVDDGSSDNSASLVTGLIEHDARFRLMPSPGNGKKEALTAGISTARGEIIVTTDADCTAAPGWLGEINKAFEDAHVKLAFGMVRIAEGAKTIQKLEALEFATVLGTGVAAFGLKKPMFCNGANLAFRKSVFYELDGYKGNDHIPSGDDTFFLDKVLKKYPAGVGLLRNTDSVVTTRPQPTLKTLFHQRLRWAGKWSLSGGITSRLLAAFMFFFQLVVMVLYGWLLLGSFPSVLAILLSGKILLDFVLIFTVSGHLRQKVSLWYFALLQIVYPFFVVTIALASFSMPYSWKDRKLPRRSTPPRSFFS